MDTVTDAQMAIAMWNAGGIGAIHRFMSIEQNLREWEAVKAEGCCAFVSVGVNSDSRERAAALYKAGARHFIIDIAHGHSKMMKDMIKWIRSGCGLYAYIMAGNIATPEGALDLFSWGADAVKIGIGPGAVCTTKNVTGVTVPQFSAIQNVCAPENREKYSQVFRKDGYIDNHNGTFPILVADGGLQEFGDIAKALGAGADLVMSGRLFAACREAPGPRINGRKVYRGMASVDAMLTIKEASVLPTPEGISTVLDTSEETVAQVVKHIKGGLQSSMSYSNSRTLKEFRSNVRFGVRA
jgi:IMP dehydrogenase